MCFKLHVYPAWWKERKGQNQQTNQLNAADQNGSLRRMVTMTTNSVALAIALNTVQVPCIPSVDTSTAYQHQGICSLNGRDSDWIVNSGTANHMTYDLNDFSSVTQLR